jgi:outer membrane protein insertion porin family
MTKLGFVSRATFAGVVLAVAGLLVAERSALAIGEAITDIRILDNQRTDEATVRSIAGLARGDILEIDTLDVVRERLNTSGLFADVNVWWEPTAGGVRVNMSVKDKFPWAPVPTASFSANNKSLGLLFVHGNLFRRGKQLVLGGRVATVDSGALIAYRDPALFGSWIYWQLQGNLQRQVIPEYDNYGPDTTLRNPKEVRETTMIGYGIEPAIGIAWFRRVKTQVAWRLERFNYRGSVVPADDNLGIPQMDATPATTGAVVGIGRASLTFDFRAREFAVMRGVALAVGLDYASPSFNSDVTFWRAGASWEHGVRLFKSHNFVYLLSANAGHNLPFWAENTAGGPNLRGYLFQQFRGDTQLAGKVEYHFPLFSVGSLDFRALAFYDLSALWFREAAPDSAGAFTLPRATPDMRTFPSEIERGFKWNQSVHNDVGGGLRFFLRSVAVPLVGFDAGYGLEAKNWRFTLIVGA